MAGTEVSFVMSEFNPKKRRYIGDCKQVILQQKAAVRDEVLGKINVGDVIEGEVKNVTNFLAFSEKDVGFVRG